MSILSSASSSSVERGYAYYLGDNVLSSRQISEFEFEGLVQGNQRSPYHVLINVKHPRKSSCDCPFANGYTTCKHMVALYFTVFPEETKDYEEWLDNAYEEEQEYGEFDEDDQSDDEVFIKPLFFDEALRNYIEKLSIQELKDHLRTELIKNPRDTFTEYLEKEYRYFLSSSSKEIALLEKIHARFIQKTIILDYDYHDFSGHLLNKSEKKEIVQIINSDSSYKSALIKLMMDEHLAVYDDYQWIIHVIKPKLIINQQQDLVEKLSIYLSTLKHYGIRNTSPKSNVLIALYNLNEFSDKEIAQSLIRNGKYDEYVKYVIENVKDPEKLFLSLKSYLNANMNRSDYYIPQLFLRFAQRLIHNEEAYKEFLYLDFLYNANLNSLRSLRNYPDFDDYYKRILANTKETYQLVPLLREMGDVDALYMRLYDKKNDHYLLANIDVLKDKYGDELNEYFKKRFYEILLMREGRKTYVEAARFVEGMFKLNNGTEITELLIKELKNSPYAKRTALFDEILTVLNQDERHLK